MFYEPTLKEMRIILEEIVKLDELRNPPDEYGVVAWAPLREEVLNLSSRINRILQLCLYLKKNWGKDSTLYIGPGGGELTDLKFEASDFFASFIRLELFFTMDYIREFYPNHVKNKKFNSNWIIDHENREVFCLVSDMLLLYEDAQNKKLDFESCTLLIMNTAFLCLGILREQIKADMEYCWEDE